MVRSSRLPALIVVGSCAEVKDLVPELKHLERVALLCSILSPRNTRSEVCANVSHVIRWVPSRSPGGQSLDARLHDGQIIDCTIDVLQGFASAELSEAFLQNPYKAVTMSLLGLDPELQILAKYGKRVPSNRDLKEAKDTSRVREVSAIQVNTLAGGSGHENFWTVRIPHGSGAQSFYVFVVYCQQRRASGADDTNRSILGCGNTCHRGLGRGTSDHRWRYATESCRTAGPNEHRPATRMVG